MGRPKIDISPSVTETRETTRYEFDLVYSGSKRVEHLFYEVPRQSALPDNFDGVLCAVVVHAMAEGRDIRLAGPATRTMLLNLREFQLAWCRWLPALYRPVEIDAASVIADGRRRAPRVLSAFSGGVDSSHTLLRHSTGSDITRYGVDTVVVVQGFDVDLANTADFRELLERTAAIREFAGVQLRIVRTNSKELNLQRWDHSFSSQLAACLHLLSAEFSEALIASSEPYDALVLPWGSSPVTDHLLSGGQLAIVHDGAAFSRTDKVAFLAGFPAALESLKVCWEGQQQGRNCGVCEKCVRTQLNLLAVGVANSPAFDKPLDPHVILNIPIRTPQALVQLESILQYAEQHHVDGDWRRLLRERVARGMKNRTRRRTFKQRLRASLDRAGLLQTAKRLQRLLAITGGV
jgi:hypothetical protein